MEDLTSEIGYALRWSISRVDLSLRLCLEFTNADTPLSTFYAIALKRTRGPFDSDIPGLSSSVKTVNNFIKSLGPNPDGPQPSPVATRPRMNEWPSETIYKWVVATANSKTIRKGNSQRVGRHNG